MPGRVGSHRDNRPDSDLFADWIAAEDHFGAAPISAFARKPTGNNPRPLRLTPRATEVPPQPSLQPEDASHVSDATTQPQQEEQHPVPAAGSPSAQPSTVPELEAPSLASAGPSHWASVPDPAETTQAPQPSPRPQQSRRRRSQVARDSYNLLWREYLALTSAAEPYHQQVPAGRQRSSARAGALSGATHLISPGGPSTSTQQPQHYPYPTASASASASTSEQRVPAAMASSSSALQSTILQGPLPYDKPKGLDALVLRLLCPPTDVFDLQRVTKLAARLVILLSSLLVGLSFALVPAWLWLIRHEVLIAHTHDAAVLAVGGLVLLFAADAIQRTAARAAATRRSGVFSATSKGAYQVAPGRYTATAQPASAAAGSATGGARTGMVGVVNAAGGSAASAATAGAASRAGGSTTAASRGAPGLANGSGAHHQAVAPSPSSADPMVRRVKQRIIKLERLLFGNDLTEADISPDALHSRVQMLCSEVGVPFGGPGGSSARPSAAELDRQLVAVEQALGV